ncbi:DUF5050 domain-containing protein [Caldalkalibacillus salinus]|uniref:DUF5050 domain-containing protein n=1 Tax=Caldalkalibacillus salinus TaxID=2803787 RepID=UPI001923E2E5|nr:DUF5050 domain-containing protein [Caldalkalibacillus salinus]
MNHKYVFIIVGILFFIAGCSGEVVELETPYQLGTDPINASQFGFVAQDDEWLYYINGDEQSQISRTDGQTVQTYNNTYGRGINVTDDYLYFTSHSSSPSGQTGLYRIPKEDPNGEIDTIHETHTNDAVIVNDYIFYTLYSSEDQAQNGLFRSDLDGQNQQQLVEGPVNAMQFFNGQLYYAIPSGGQLLRTSPDGHDVTPIKTEEGLDISTTQFIVTERWIYFENEDSNFDSFYAMDHDCDQCNIYRMSIDGSTVEPLASGSLHTFDQREAFLYYSSSGERQHLMSRHVDSDEVTEIYNGEEEWHWVNAIGDQLFFIHWNPEKTTRLYELDRDSGEIESFEP